MIRLRQSIPVTAGIAACCTVMFVVGCGGGSSSKPKITARPKPGANGGGGNQTANGGKKNGGAVAPEGFGSLSGKITFEGTPPTRTPIQQTKPDDFCMSVKAKVLENLLIVDQATKGIKNVVIYIKQKPSGYTATPPTEPKQYDNNNCLFEPRVLAVQVGQPIVIRNLDPTAHNTKISPLNNQQIDSKLSAKQGDKIESDTIKYDLPEFSDIKVECAFHPWMRGVHYIFDHPFFAQTDKDGKFTIKNFPAGKHTVIVWHEKAGQLLEKEVTIEKGKPTEFNEKFGSQKLAGVAPRPTKTVVLNLGR